MFWEIKKSASENPFDGRNLVQKFARGEMYDNIEHDRLHNHALLYIQFFKQQSFDSRPESREKKLPNP